LIRLGLAGLLVVGAVWASPAAATVVIVRPSSPSAQVGETLSRIRGELLSIGVDVTLADRPSQADHGLIDAPGWLQMLAQEQGARAIIEIIGTDVVVAVDLWVVKPPRAGEPYQLEVTRVAAEPAANPPQRLALRAIEALRAGLLAMDLFERRPRELANQPLPAAVTAQSAAPQGPRESFALEVGVAGLVSLDGAGPAVLPLLRLAWAATSRLMVQAAFAGLGSRPSLATASGSARLDEGYGVLAMCYRLRPDRQWWPFLAVAAGALRTSADGQAGAGTEGHDLVRWSMLFEGSSGVGASIYRRYFATLAADAQMAEPYLAIHLGGLRATIGRPNLLLIATLGARL
jgi:hypothetical protein